MPIYKPSELRTFLEGLGTAPKKGLSQNFLIDGNIIRKIAAESNVESGDIILEIGPGPGSLTEELLSKGAFVIAVEKDILLANALERLQTPDKRLSIFCQDIMTFKVEEEVFCHLKKGKKAKVIANLPYHLTTPILSKLIPLEKIFSSLTVMVQEEVARRMVALPGTEDYSSLSLFLKFYSFPHYAFFVSRNCFFPSPKVDSAIAILKLHEAPLDPERAVSFFELTRTAFGHRRKMLRASLKDLFPPKSVEEALAAIGQNPLARPETLSLEQFLELHALLSRI